jgi:CHASE2 domain-containing sensor protein
VVLHTRRTTKLTDVPYRGLALLGKLAAALVVVLVGEALGLWAAADERLVATFYAVRGARASQQAVILVAVDDETMARWGPPPYGWDRLGALTAAVARGGPSVVALVEPGQRLARAEIPPRAASEAMATGRLLAPAPVGTSLPPPATAVDALPVAATLTAEILARSGLHATRDPLPIDYLGGDSLPEVSAARVAAGDLPAATFAGKVVLVGITARAATTTLPTPVGPLAPAEIQAQAILGLTDGVAWRIPGAGARWLLAAAVGLAVLLITARFDETRALILFAAAALALVVLCYLLFARGVALLGPSLAAATALAAVLVQGFVERRALRGGLAELARDLRLRVGLDSLGPDARSDAAAAFWVRIAELARLYLDCRSSIVAELPPGRWHLAFRVLVGTSIAELREQRRDVRRGAYHRAHLALGQVWQDDFMAEELGQRTLLVPLVVATRLTGFWILNFPAAFELEPAQQKLVDILARQIALAVDRRQTALARPESHPLVELLAPSRLEEKLGGLGADLRRLGADKRGLATLLDGLPYGVLVATLWGEVRYANRALVKLLAEEGESRVQTMGIGEVLLALSVAQKDEVYGGLRRLVREQAELSLPGKGQTQLALSWLGREARSRDGVEEEQLLLLTALPAGVEPFHARAPELSGETTAFVRR